MRIGCCEWLVKPLVDADIPKQNIDVYEIDKVYDYKVFKISPVKLFHGDCPQCGYRIFIGDEKAIYMTDTSTVDHIEAQDYNLYLIEGNFGEDEMLERIKEKQENGEFAYEISAMQRHLSREKAQAFLLENMGKHSRYEYLHMHKEKENRNDDEC